MDIRFDLNALSLADAEDLEEYTGISIVGIEGVLKSGSVPTRLLTGMVWIARRQADPSFTLAQARELKVADLNVELDRLPKAGAAEAAASHGSALSSTGSPA